MLGIGRGLDNILGGVIVEERKVVHYSEASDGASTSSITTYDNGEIVTRVGETKMTETPESLTFEADKIDFLEVSTPAATEVETKVKQSLKGLTIEQALKLLDNVRNDLVYHAPISEGFRKVIE